MDTPKAAKLIGIIVTDRQIGPGPEADSAPFDVSKPSELVAVPGLADGLTKQKLDAAVELLEVHLPPKTACEFGSRLFVCE